MEMHPKDISSLEIENALTSDALNDLKTLLNAIKDRTTLLSNSISPENPLQQHFQEIITDLNESLDTTNFITDSFELNHLIKDKNN